MQDATRSYEIKERTRQFLLEIDFIVFFVLFFSRDVLDQGWPTQGACPIGGALYCYKWCITFKTRN